MARNTKVSQYGQGFTNGVIIRGLPINQVNPGEVFWVNNSTVLPDGSVTGSDGNTGKYLSPLSTVDGAVNKCVAGRGDIIMVMPGHAETLTASTDLVLDVAGVAIVGLGQGSLRPTFTNPTAASTIAVSAANVSVTNMIFVANKANTASCFTLAAAAEFNVENCEFRDTSATLEWLSIITTSTVANAADGLRFHNNKVFGLSVAPLAIISILEAIARLEVSDNYSNVVATSSGGELITLSSFASLQTRITGNIHRIPEDRATGLMLTGSGTSTGIFANNLLASLTATSDLISTATTGLVFFKNFHSGAVDKSGYLLPAVDAA